MLSELEKRMAERFINGIMSMRHDIRDMVFTMNIDEKLHDLLCRYCESKNIELTNGELKFGGVSLVPMSREQHFQSVFLRLSYRHIDKLLKGSENATSSV